jgi:hypothetical protein
MGIFNFSKIIPGSQYYIVVRTKAALETWSTIPVTVPSGSPYNFSTGIGQAYGNNMRLINGVSCIYVGDLDQDGAIDGTDYAEIDNDIYNFALGYIRSDLNWDGIVDGSDAIYSDNNAFNFIGVVKP